MRLVCPNCGAQYEVDDRVMPEDGRDVQCSACGHAWFQRGPFETQLDDEGEEYTSGLVEDDAASEDDETEYEIIDEASESTDDDAPQDDPAAPTPRLPPKRELGPDVTSILQEEAERELDARQSEQEQLETQTEMGLDDVAPDEAHRQSIRERMARLRGSEDGFEAGEALTEGRSRDLLPDIEEINSTLDANHESQAGVPVEISEADRPTGGGFRRGFLLVVILSALMLALYTYAPALSERQPSLKPILDQFVSLVDHARVALNSLAEIAITKMQGFESGS